MIAQRQKRAASAPASARSSRSSSPAAALQQPASATSVVAPSGRVLVGVASGPVNRLLQAERTCLEVLTRASACATYARRCVEFAQCANPTWPGRVAATRKTTPGAMRAVEKYGAICGGADPHRYSLSSMVMLKDNHIDACGGSIPAAVERARSLAGFSTKVEVECRSLDDAFAAASAGAHVVMLDNFTPAAAHEAARAVKEKYPYVLVEASGGMRAETLGAYCSDYIDVISVGQITHGPPPCDISMKVAKAGAMSKALIEGDDARVKRSGKL
jgi:nicotinate-nucleotide pyrophosphorylase (carboxylating)